MMILINQITVTDYSCSHSCVVHGYIDKSILYLNNFDVNKLNEKIFNILSEKYKISHMLNMYTVV